MKNIVIAVSVLIVAITASCAPTQRRQSMSRPQQGYAQQQRQGQPVRSLKSVTVNKRQTGHCEARIIAGPDNIPSNQQRVAEYASQVYMKTGRVPSESELTQKFGFRTQARWIDTPDRIVQSVTVRPDELPPNIRARFQ